jgi:hypothetical protein
VFDIASFICVAASTLPPNVLTVKIIETALFVSASLIDLSIYGGRPRSIVPSIGIL